MVMKPPEDILTYEVFEDRDSPEDWRVEGIDHASEGECYIAIFVGFGAEARAREYAAWKNEHAGGSKIGWRGGRT